MTDTLGNRDTESIGATNMVPGHSHGTDEGCTSVLSGPPGGLQPTRPASQSWGHNARTLHLLKLKNHKTTPSQNQRDKADEQAVPLGFMYISPLTLTNHCRVGVVTTILFMRNRSSQGFKNLANVSGGCGHPRAADSKTVIQ